MIQCTQYYIIYIRCSCSHICPQVVCWKTDIFRGISAELRQTTKQKIRAKYKSHADLYYYVISHEVQACSVDQEEETCEKQCWPLNESLMSASKIVWWGRVYTITMPIWLVRLVWLLCFNVSMCRVWVVCRSRLSGTPASIRFAPQTKRNAEKNIGSRPDTSEWGCW